MLLSATTLMQTRTWPGAAPFPATLAFVGLLHARRLSLAAGATPAHLARRIRAAASSSGYDAATGSGAAGITEASKPSKVHTAPLRASALVGKVGLVGPAR